MQSLLNLSLRPDYRFYLKKILAHSDPYHNL